MDLEKMSVEQLKSAAYDQIVLLEQVQRNLQLINTEIKKRNDVKPVDDVNADTAVGH